MARTHNRAAIEILAMALVAPQGEVRCGAVRTLVRRRDTASHDTIIRHYAGLAEAEQLALQAALREAPERMTAALRDAVVHGDGDACVNACNIILLGQIYELLPLLAKTAEDRVHRHASQVGAALLRLATLLHQETSAATGGTRRGRRDPFFVRRQSLAALGESLARYNEHRRLEILEAFLLLAPPDHKMLQMILRDPLEAAHHQLVASLADSRTPGVMQCAVGLLYEADAPPAALRIIAQRRDRPFLELLFRSWRKPASLRVRQNLSRLTRVAWLEADREVLLQLDERAQAAGVELARYSSIGRDALLQCLAFLLFKAGPEGRQAACDALTDFRGKAATELVLAALRDPDPRVQAAAAVQLRHRHVSAESAGFMPIVFDFNESAARTAAEQSRGTLGHPQG